MTSCCSSSTWNGTVVGPGSHSPRYRPAGCRPHTHRAARVEHHGERIGSAGPAGGLVGQDRSGGGAGRKGGAVYRPWARLSAVGAGVPDRYADIVRAGGQAKNLLEEHALVGAQGLLKGGDPDDLIPGQLDRTNAFALGRRCSPGSGQRRDCLRAERPARDFPARDPSSVMTESPGPAAKATVPTNGSGSPAASRPSR